MNTHERPISWREYAVFIGLVAAAMLITWLTGGASIGDLLR
jgi:hypothetical protein